MTPSPPLPPAVQKDLEDVGKWLESNPEAFERCEDWQTRFLKTIQVLSENLPIRSLDKVLSSSQRSSREERSKRAKQGIYLVQYLFQESIRDDSRDP
ncbi:unnamed protein product [Diabrotica balteata]|uniref:Uncharacterized protein n=1 Tax=Diabrotica balteata TaxID=107213 RepID=A0A9N9XI34_DIABA|nr:unnamed protein product [Diabrotica balteata]